MAKLVSKTYGDALFELALEKDMLDDVWDEVKVLSQIWKENKEFSDLLIHPGITKEDKIALIKNIFNGRASDIIIGLLDVMVEKGRTAELESVLDYFTDRVREHENIGVAYITSAVELNNVQKDQIQKRLLDVTKYIKFEMYFSVDLSLIGGMVIRIGDRVLDSSIKQKLNVMARDLSKVKLSEA